MIVGTLKIPMGHSGFFLICLCYIHPNSLMEEVNVSNHYMIF